MLLMQCNESELEGLIVENGCMACFAECNKGMARKVFVREAGALVS
jgi:hypothetical protein